MTVFPIHDARKINPQRVPANSSFGIKAVGAWSFTSAHHVRQGKAFCLTTQPMYYLVIRIKKKKGICIAIRSTAELRCIFYAINASVVTIRAPSVDGHRRSRMYAVHLFPILIKYPSSRVLSTTTFFFSYCFISLLCDDLIWRGWANFFLFLFYIKCWLDMQFCCGAVRRCYLTDVKPLA